MVQNAGLSGYEMCCIPRGLYRDSKNANILLSTAVVLKMVHAEGAKLHPKYLVGL